MKKCFMFGCLLLLSSQSLFASSPYQIKCYSSGNLFYQRQANEVDVGEGFVIIHNKGNDEFISADCVISYPTKAHYKHKHPKR